MDKFTIVQKKDRDSFIKKINKILDTSSVEYLIVLTEKKSSDKEIIRKMIDILDRNPDIVLVSPKKPFKFPDRMEGVMIRLSSVGELRLNEKLKYSYEADFLLRLINKKEYKILSENDFVQTDIGDGNYRNFIGSYDKSWYTEDMDTFLFPLIEDICKMNGGTLPHMHQYFIMYYLKCRFDANKDNRNKHILSEEDLDLFLERAKQAMQYVEDRIIIEDSEYPCYAKEYSLRKMFLTLKHDGTFPEMEVKAIRKRDSRHSGLALCLNDAIAYSSGLMKCNVLLMDYKDGYLRMDCSVPDVFDTDRFSFFFKCNGVRYDVDFNSSYSLRKYFGKTAYKRTTFSVNIQIDGLIERGAAIGFYLGYHDREYIIPFEFKSHTSRLTDYPKNSYWHFGKWMATTGDYTKLRDPWALPNKDSGCDCIIIKRYSVKKAFLREFRIAAELLFSFSMHRFRFFLLRCAWLATRPLFANKKIWLFFDKIYKAGDSSEYLYKYACKERDGIKKYYLIDKKCPDYKRLRKEGIRPLVRGSFLHRLVFLNADVIFATNSTVFAFNDYYLENSRYIRGIPHFKVVCLQHGLSVQKIGMAQHRLRDNIALYYCASECEIENLKHPVYNFEDYPIRETHKPKADKSKYAIPGYSALRLTGIPRYDGLVSKDKKQIMISPTWRMQSAMPVTKNEGVERDYNPDFKKTEYYRIYNSLINSRELCEAAKKYGYKIVYILHPIVSPQKKDFKTNPYVDIIASSGDMSYEKYLTESSLLVTDYSGIQFDFAYMKKPVVYYHPKTLEAHYEEGSFCYDTMAFGEIEDDEKKLISTLTDYMKSGCKMKDEYKSRVDRFYVYHDRDNCKRVYEDVKEEQKLW